MGKGTSLSSGLVFRQAWCTHSESMLAPRTCASRSSNSFSNFAKSAISVGQMNMKSFGQKKYTFHFPGKSRSVMVRNAFCGSRSVSTVAVSEYEGNFSPIPNIVFSPLCGTMTLKLKLTLYESSQRVQDICDVPS